MAVGVKAFSSARSSETGVRAGLRRSDVSEALARLSQYGEVVDYRPSLGVALMRIDPAEAIRLQSEGVVDYAAPLPKMSIADVEAEHTYSPMLARSTSATEHRAGKRESFRPVVDPIRASIGGSQLTGGALELMNVPAAWVHSTGSGTKVMLLSAGTYPHADNPAIPSGNCAGLFNACNSSLAAGAYYLSLVAARDNTSGAVGVAHGLTPSNIYIWRALNPNNSTWDSWSIVSGIEASVSVGAKTLAIIGVTYNSHWDVLANAVAYARANDVLVIAGVGDGGSSNVVNYPAAYTGVIGVGGVSLTGLSTHSAQPECESARTNSSPHTDLVAPARGYGNWVSSSFAPITTWNIGCTTATAVAHVAGVAALVRSKFPQMTAAQVTDRLITTASQPHNRTNAMGYGFPNALNAVYTAPPPEPEPNPVDASISGASHRAPRTQLHLPCWRDWRKRWPVHHYVVPRRHAARHWRVDVSDRLPVVHAVDSRLGWRRWLRIQAQVHHGRSELEHLRA